MTSGDPTQFLQGKTAIVTGAGRGIGRAIAKRLAVNGVKVAITSRTADQLAETQKLLERGGGRVFAQTADVTSAQDVDRLVERTRELFGPIDFLVNNAGAAPLAPIEEMEPAMFEHILASNIRSVYLCSRAVWPNMRENGGGAIVNIASIAAFDPFPGFAAYGAAKAFVVAYTRGLATEGAPHGIRVFAVAPGAVETDMLRGAFPDFPGDKLLYPDDIATMVETMLSPTFRHSSGQTVMVSKSA